MNWCPSSVGLRFLALVFVVLGLSMGVVYQSRLVSPQHPDTRAAFQDLDGVHIGSPLHKAWAPRIAALEFADKFVKLVERGGLAPQSAAEASRRMHLGIAFWTAGWFAAVCVVWMLALRERSLFYMLGTYACVSFGYVSGDRMYPWDMPALFAFTMFVALLAAGLRGWRFTVAAAGLIWATIPFKETALLLCIFPILACDEWRLRRRVAALVIIAGVGLGMKLSLNYLANGSLQSVATRSFYDEGSLLSWNLRLLFSRPVVLINAGTLVALFLMPIWRGKLLLLKVVAAGFIVGNFLFGVVTEYRIWFELIPGALYALDIGMLQRDRRGASSFCQH